MIGTGLNLVVCKELLFFIALVMCSKTKEVILYTFFNLNCSSLPQQEPLPRIIAIFFTGITSMKFKICKRISLLLSLSVICLLGITSTIMDNIKYNLDTTLNETSSIYRSYACGKLKILYLNRYPNPGDCFYTR